MNKQQIIEKIKELGEGRRVVTVTIFPTNLVVVQYVDNQDNYQWVEVGKIELGESLTLKEVTR